MREIDTTDVGCRCPKFTSTMASVPPASTVASGVRAGTSSASARLSGTSTVIERRPECSTGDAIVHAPMTASTSISTFHSGLSRAFTTTVVLAGRISANFSPCTLDTAPKSAASTRYTRERTTSSRVAPASCSAVSNLETTACLYAGVGVDRSIGPLRCRSHDHDAISDAHGAAVADDQLPWAPGGDELSLSHRRPPPRPRTYAAAWAGGNATNHRDRAAPRPPRRPSVRARSRPRP